MDDFDDSGLMPGSAPWMLPPDAGIESPQAFATGPEQVTHGGDVHKTILYPSQESRQAVDWPRDGGFSMTPITDTQKGY